MKPSNLHTLTLYDVHNLLCSLWKLSVAGVDAKVAVSGLGSVLVPASCFLGSDWIEFAGDTEDFEHITVV